MSNSIATIQHIRGETITFGIRAADPEFDGTETLTCDVKVSSVGAAVPPESQEAVISITPQYVPTAGDEVAHWLFLLTPEQSEMMNAGNYITDTRIEFADGNVDYAEPLRISLKDRVTA